jgi:hypothetical protein
LIRLISESWRSHKQHHSQAKKNFFHGSLRKFDRFDRRRQAMSRGGNEKAGIQGGSGWLRRKSRILFPLTN